ncbi:MAG: hypothetical protein Kow00108_09260 [Calditrichia bacterium]
MPLLTIHDFENCLKKNPSSKCFSYFAALLIEHDVDRAIEICKTHLPNHPEYAMGYFVLGSAYFEKTEYSMALENLEMAVLLNPTLVKAWELLLAIYSQEGNQEKIDHVKAFLHYWQSDNTSVKSENQVNAEPLIEETEASTDTLEEVGIDDEQMEQELLGELDFAVEEEMIEELVDDATDQPVIDEDQILSDDDLISPDELDNILEDNILPEESNDSMMEETADSTTVEQTEDTFKVPEAGALEEEGEEIKDLTFNDVNLKDESVIDSEPEQDKKEEESIHSEPDFEEDVDTVEKEIMEELNEDLSLSDASEITESELISEDKIVAVEAGKSEELNQQQVEQEIAESLGDFEVNTADESDVSVFTQSDNTGETVVVTSTLGEIYIAQGKFKEALQVFETLLEENPDNRRYKRKVKELQDLMQEAGNQ